MINVELAPLHREHHRKMAVMFTSLHSVEGSYTVLGVRLRSMPVDKRVNDE